MYGVVVKKGPAIFPRLDIEKELEELAEIGGKAAGGAGAAAGSDGAAGTDGVVAGSDGAESESVPLELKPEIVYDDFAKIDFRVGIIEKAEKHPKADKLLVFQVKMGTERRQVISGVAEDFTPEEMVGKKVIVVANLKPRQLRGMESKGMLLFADNGKRCEIVTTTAPDGEVVS